MSSESSGTDNFSSTEDIELKEFGLRSNDYSDSGASADFTASGRRSIKENETEEDEVNEVFTTSLNTSDEKHHEFDFERTSLSSLEGISPKDLNRTKKSSKDGEANALTMKAPSLEGFSIRRIPSVDPLEGPTPRIASSLDALKEPATKNFSPVDPLERSAPRMGSSLDSLEGPPLRMASSPDPLKEPATKSFSSVDPLERSAPRMASSLDSLEGPPLRMASSPDPLKEPETKSFSSVDPLERSASRIASSLDAFEGSPRIASSLDALKDPATINPSSLDSLGGPSTRMTSSLDPLKKPSTGSNMSLDSLERHPLRMDSSLSLDSLEEHPSRIASSLNPVKKPATGSLSSLDSWKVNPLSMASSLDSMERISAQTSSSPGPLKRSSTRRISSMNPLEGPSTQTVWSSDSETSSVTKICVTDNSELETNTVFYDEAPSEEDECCYIIFVWLINFLIPYSRQIRHSTYFPLLYVALLTIPCSVAYMSSRYKEMCHYCLKLPHLVWFSGLGGMCMIIIQILSILSKRYFAPNLTGRELKYWRAFIAAPFYLCLFLEMTTVYLCDPDFIPSKFNATSTSSQFCIKIFYDYTYYMNIVVVLVHVLLMLIHVPGWYDPAEFEEE